MKKISDLFRSQKKFNDLFFDVSDLDDIQKEEITKSLALCLHSEVSSLISAINFKDHRKNRREIDKCKILFESVDAFRYLLAILNVWEIPSDKFLEAFNDKDEFLNLRHTINKTSWSGEPVVIVDMDDVMTDFRKDFAGWIEKTYNIKMDVDSPEYYFVEDLTKNNINPEEIFLDFVSIGSIRKLSKISGINEFLKGLKDRGFWIQILTARPKENLRCFYDTYGWLSDNDIIFDNLEFSAEKFRWCAQSKYYDSGAIKFAIDDSPKHAEDYSKHGIKCWAPVKSYNKQALSKDRIFAYSDFKEILLAIDNNQCK